ncbi:putative tail fiber protein [Serratia phage vB_SmaM-ChuuTotoro]|nr:putative tail fiber protein [Serratia phage vB_SmaM-ChuuTotoro]
MANERANVNPEFYAAVDQLILDAERVHGIVNGLATQGVTVEDGSVIPTIRKAMIDNLYFKTPPFPWKPGSSTTVFNQLYTYSEPNLGASWWYAPAATTIAPVVMKDKPHDDPNWRLIIDTASIADIYAPLISPLFKGNPRGPTPAEGDDSTTLATTAFVVAAITKAMGDPNQGVGSFNNLTVRNKTTTRTIEVTEDAKFVRGPIDATAVRMLLNTLHLMGNDGKLDFDYLDPAYADKLRTVIRPHTITTSDITSDTSTTGTSVVGNAVDPVTGANALTVHGNADMDYLTLTGNGARPVGDPQLVVQGKAVIKDLQVTGTATGITATVDGQDTKPASVDTDQVTTKRLTVTESMSVTGTSTIGNVKFTGTVEGITFPAANVDGKDIKPRSVVTTNDSTFGGKTTVKDLVVTGTTTGITADVTGKDIRPKSASTTEYLNVGTNATITGQTTTDKLKVNDGKVIYNDTPTTEAVIDLAALAGGSDGVGKYLSVSVGLGAGERKYYQNPFPGYAVDVKVFINPLGSSTDSYESGWGYAPDDKDGNKMKMFGVRGMRQKIASGSDQGDWIVIQVAEGGAAHKPELVGGGNSNVNEAIKNTGSFQIRVTRLFKDAGSTPATPK